MVGGQGGQGGGMLGQAADQLRQQGNTGAANALTDAGNAVLPQMYNMGTNNDIANMASHPASTMDRYGTMNPGGAQQPTGQGPAPGGMNPQPGQSPGTGPRTDAGQTAVPEPPVSSGTQANLTQPEPRFGDQVQSQYAGGELSQGPPPGSPIMMASLSGSSQSFSGSPAGGETTNNSTTSGVPVPSGGESYSNPADRGSFMPTSNNIMTASINPAAQESPAAMASFNQGVQSGAINPGNIGNLISQMNKTQPPPPPPTMTA
jgi:hypothetical protein